MSRKRVSARNTAGEHGVCAHDYRFDEDLEDWVCSKCGRSLGLVSKEQEHACGPDCDIHGEVSGIG